EARAGFAAALAYTNWLHAIWVAAAAVFVNTVFGLLPEIYYYRTAYWPVDRAHLTLTALHEIMVVVSLTALATFRLCRPCPSGQGQPCHQRLAIGYAMVMVAAVTLFSLAEYRLTGSMSAYLFGVAAFATLFYSTPRTSLVVMGGSFVGLVAGSVLPEP